MFGLNRSIIVRNNTRYNRIISSLTWKVLEVSSKEFRRILSKMRCIQSFVDHTFYFSRDIIGDYYHIILLSQFIL